MLPQLPARSSLNRAGFVRDVARNAGTRGKAFRRRKTTGFDGPARLRVRPADLSDFLYFAAMDERERGVAEGDRPHRLHRAALFAEIPLGAAARPAAAWPLAHTGPQARLAAAIAGRSDPVGHRHGVVRSA